jgi:K+-transporting ATPase ATPase A chain
MINNVPLPVVGSVEKGIWRVLGIAIGDELASVSDGHSAAEYCWADCAVRMLMLQGILPLNPQQCRACPGIWR